MATDSTDPLIDKTEALLEQHEQDELGKEAPMPGNNMSDNDVMNEIKMLMDLPGVEHLCGMIIINWHVYAVIRQELEAAAGIKLTSEVFAALLQGLQVTAMEKFSIDDLKRDLKKKMAPWIREVCDQRVKKGSQQHGDAKLSEDDA